jgi:hypothetical protein
VAHADRADEVTVLLGDVELPVAEVLLMPSVPQLRFAGLIEEAAKGRDLFAFEKAQGHVGSARLAVSARHRVLGHDSPAVIDALFRRRQ